jgi:hypothetical protein
MKKSFLYAVPAALIMALLFAGCPQDSDDGDEAGTIPSYQKDVDGIAVAFADGAPVVYLKDNLHLGNNELVIPAGKTLDLQQNVTIDEIGTYGKIIVVGSIEFTSGENAEKYDILLHKSPTAKIIATKQFIDANVDSRYTQNAEGTVVLDNDPETGVQYTKNLDKHIKALPDQVIEIADFDIGNANAWETYITEHSGDDNAQYIPVQFNGTINDSIAKVVGKYGSGRRVYIIGGVTITAHIDLTGKTPWYPASTPNTVQPVQYNVAEDADGSLLIAGAVVFEGSGGRVSTDGGLTVLGTLAVKGERGGARVNAKGKLITYLLRLDSGGGIFTGEVELIGSLPSRFGGQAIFEDTLKARGTVIIDGGQFNKGANFSGPVEFVGPDANIVIKSPAAGSITITGPITLTFNEGTPVNISDGVRFNINSVPSVVYNEPYGTTGAYTINVPVTFNANASFSDVATFGSGAVFNSELTLASDKKYNFGKAATNGKSLSTYFAKAVTIDPIKQLGGGSFGIPVTFNGPAVFKGGSVTFKEKAFFNNTFELNNAAGTFSEGAEFSKSVKFAAGSQVTIGKASGAGTLLHKPSGLFITSLGAYISYVKPDAGDKGAVLLTEQGELQFGGTLALGSAAINIGNGIIRIPTAKTSGIVFGSGSTPVANHGKGYVVSDAYTVKAGTSAGGTLVGLFGTVTSTSKAEYVYVDKAGFRGDGSGSQAVLRVAGSYAATPAPSIEVSNDITIDGVTLDFAYGSNISAGSITISEKGSPIITLKGGKGVAVTTGNVTAGAVGGIKLSPTAAVYGGTVGVTAASSDIPPGYLFSLSGKLVTGATGGTYSEAVGGTVGTLGTEDNSVSFITDIKGAGFAVYIQKPLDISGVKGILDSTGDKKLFVERGRTVTGGSVAVFAGTLAE